MSGGGGERDDSMVSLIDMPFEPVDLLRILRDELEAAGIEVEVTRWNGGSARPGSPVMASVMVRASELASAQRAVGHLLDDGADPTDPDQYWDLATAGNAADAELLTTALADVGIGSMVTPEGQGWSRSISVLRDDLADAVRLVRRLADRAPTLALDPDLEGMRLKRQRLPDAARRKQRRRIRRW